jgi:hypothetical protein
VLSAARATDTSLVQSRLARFERVHRDYVEAQQTVDAAEAQRRAAETRLADSDAVQGRAVTAVSAALIVEGQPPRNPFANLGVPPPGQMKKLSFAKAVAAVRQLVAAVQRDPRFGEATIKAAQVAEKAARVVEQALVPVEKLAHGVREARRMREVRGQAWDAALAALKHDARAAARDGVPQLHAALFPPSRPATKTKTPAANGPPAPDTPPAPTPPITETPQAA